MASNLVDDSRNYALQMLVTSYEGLSNIMELKLNWKCVSAVVT